MTENRREVSSRNLSFFHRLAQRLVKLGLRPNQISVLSCVFALMAGIALAQAGSPDFTRNVFLIIVALIGIQLRLGCNLIDGLMAVEGGLKTPTGELYNDIPDRLSDIFIIVGTGYSASILNPHYIDLAWAAAVTAVLTAYIRVLGGSMGTKHYFIGPMAKQHRMFVINAALIASLIESKFSIWGYALSVAIVVILVGSLITCYRRIRFIALELKDK
jgi:phosphatidylglycerophosphate synthase